MCYDKLKEQSKIILRERRIQIIMLVWFSLCLFVFSYATIKAESVVVGCVALVLVLAVLLTVKDIKNNNLLLKQLLSIEKNNTLNKTYQVVLNDPKIILQSISEIPAKRMPSTSWQYYAIKIVSNKDKYFYFLESTLDCHDKDDRQSAERIKEKFKGKICIECYNDTSIVKKIEGSPTFIHIRYGKWCE